MSTPGKDRRASSSGARTTNFEAQPLTQPLQKDGAVLGGPHRVGSHHPAVLHPIVGQRLLKTCQGLQGSGHALRGQLAGLGQAPAQAGDFPEVQQELELPGSSGLRHRQAHGEAAQIDGGETDFF